MKQWYEELFENFSLKPGGFSTSEIPGCKLGAFSRNDKLSTGDFELLVIAEK